MSDRAEREARYAEAIFKGGRYATPYAVARVMALADQEQAELQERLRAVEALAELRGDS